MRKWIALLLAAAMMMSMCACGGESGAASEKAPEESTTESTVVADESSVSPSLEITEPANEPETTEAEISMEQMEEAPVPEAYVFSLRDDIHFGETIDEITAKETKLDFDSKPQDGYYCAQVKDKLGISYAQLFLQEAYLFYYFDVENEELEEIEGFWGHGNDPETANTYYELLTSIFIPLYGNALDESAQSYIPIHTTAYERIVSHDGLFINYSEWICRDNDSYVLIELVNAFLNGDSYYTFLGFKSITESLIEEIGGNISLIPDEMIGPPSSTQNDSTSTPSTAAPGVTSVPSPSPVTATTTTGERNALEKAKDYLDFMAFSYSGLIEQLEFEGFTHSEAVYGADNCGADWYEQAAIKAADYLDLMAFSKTGLIEQLEFEGFTHEQAVYGAEQNGY